MTLMAIMTVCVSRQAQKPSSAACPVQFGEIQSYSQIITVAGQDKDMVCTVLSMATTLDTLLIFMLPDMQACHGFAEISNAWKV